MATDAERIKELEETVKKLQSKINLYEQDGSAKLYYSLQRKMSEIATIMNNTSLVTLSLDDKNDKTFERLKVMWTDSKSISETIKIIGENAGITGDEKNDINKKPFVDTLADKRE